MTLKEKILRAWDLKVAEEPLVAIFGGGPWAMHYFGKSFTETAKSGAALAELVLQANDLLNSPIVYVGSGFNNFHAAALGGKIRAGVAGAPDLEEPLVKSASALADVDPARLDSDLTINTIREAAGIIASEIGERFLVTVTSWAPFTLGAQIFGVERMMRTLKTDPAAAKEVISFAGRIIKRFFKPLIDENVVAAVSLADPTASGDLISAEQFRAFALEPLTDVIGGFKVKDARTLLHICGHTADRWNLILETGAACISLDHKVSLEQADKSLAGRISFGGNVDPVKVLKDGTPDEIRQAADDSFRAAGSSPGFILLPGCDLPPGAPLENLKAFLGSGQEWAARYRDGVLKEVG